MPSTLSVAPSTIVCRLAAGDLLDATPLQAAGLILSGTALTAVTVAGADKVLIQDDSASDALRTVTAQSIADLASAGGDVAGPASSTNNALVRFDLATGKLIQNSLAILTDAGALSGITSLVMAGALSGITTLNLSGNLVTTGLIDTRDVAGDGAVLDGIEPGADITDEANVTIALDGATPGLVTPLVADSIFIQDDSDTDKLKLATVQSIVDLAGGNGARSLLINGNVLIWQRGTTFTAAVNEYTADRWAWRDVGAGVVDILQSVDVPDGFSEFSIHVDVTTADASLAASDIYGLEYRIEGFDAMPLALGTSDAPQMTLSFWVKSTITGIHTVALQNSAVDRSYPAEYTVDVTDTWEKKTVTLTGDTTGTWLKDNGIGMALFFALAAGSNFTGTPDTWNGADDKASTNQVNSMSDAANNFRLAQVQLEVGDTASDLVFRPFSEELALCQRYYQKTFPYATTPAQNAGSEAALQYTCLRAGVSITRYEWDLPVQLRADPAGGTQTFYSPGAATSDWWNSTPTAQLSGLSGAQGVTGENRVVISNLQVANDQLTDLIQIHATVDIEL